MFLDRRVRVDGKFFRLNGQKWYIKGFSYGPFALCAIPLCGAYVAGVWQIVTLIIRVKEVHGISGWRARSECSIA